MTDQPNPSIGSWFAELCQLADRKSQLEGELAQVNARLAELSGKGVGKRSLPLLMKQTAEMMELERRCNERDPTMTTEKQVIMGFIEDMLRSEKRRPSDAKTLYPRYRKRLTRWREKSPA